MSLPTLTGPHRTGAFLLGGASALALAFALASCDGGGGAADPNDPASVACAPDADGGTAPPPDKHDVLPPSRVLRRASLVLRGAPPTDAELDELGRAGDVGAQQAYVDAFIDRVLTEPVFYRTMFELGREWLNVPMVEPSADPPEYGPQQQRSLLVCPAGTVKAGAWHYYREALNACDGKKTDGSPVDVVSVEPWWAPGTQVTLVGDAANTTNKGSSSPQGNPVVIDCNGSAEGTCGCGPNATGCHADVVPGWDDYAYWNPTAQRRYVSEEPARLFAHIAWNDRAVTDLVLGSYSVGPTKLQAAYVRQGAAGGVLSLLTDDSWWRPSRFGGAPVDPEHAPQDPAAWREFQVPARNPFLLADRSYRFDPRIEAGPMRGIPAAGILTSLGFLAGLPRERLRAARALENLACEVFTPPQGLTFNPYVRDPYSEGPCQHCHKRIDPAAIHFKRWGKRGDAFEGWGATYLMPGIGSVWRWPKGWRQGDYPYGSDPFAHWNRWWTHDTGLLPASQAQIDANPEVAFMDFLPPSMTLLNEKSDGTVGPLGFAKLIVAAGAFDRCVVRHLHTHVLGRDIDLATESGYLDVLTASFVNSQRRVRPFVKALTQSDSFRRGR